MPRFGGIVQTVYGPVAVSEKEAELLEVRQDMDRFNTVDDPRYARVKARADMLLEACNRVALYKCCG